MFLLSCLPLHNVVAEGHTDFFAVSLDVGLGIFDEVVRIDEDGRLVKLGAQELVKSSQLVHAHLCVRPHRMSTSSKMPGGVRDRERTFRIKVFEASLFGCRRDAQAVV